MPSRRALLAGVSGLAAPSVAGCLRGTSVGDGEPTADGTGTPTPTQTPDLADADPDVHRGRDEVELHATERFDEDEEITYFPGNETVEYPRLLEGDGEVKEYGELPFEEFARMQCRTAALDPARDHVETRLDDDVAYGSSFGRTGSLEGAYAKFTYYEESREDPHGERPATEVDLEEFIDAVPRSVSVTLVFEDREHDCEPPVYVVAE